MHIDKKSGDFNEENYISCILDDDSTEIPPAAAGKTPSPGIVEQPKVNVIKRANPTLDDTLNHNGSDASIAKR